MTERAYDPELVPFLPTLPTESQWDDMPAARANMAEMLASMPTDPALEEAVAHADRVIPGPADAPELSVRVYTPRTEATVRPGVLYIHGGGFCVGSIETEHQGALRAAAHADAVLVSVEYRLAPEHPFPAGIEDCYAGLVWLAEQAPELGVDLDRIAVMGGSAGGGLAAGVALMARDRRGPRLCFQLLGIPELDHRLETPSMVQFTDTPLWNRPNAILSWRYYLGLSGEEGEEAKEVSPYASPAIAEDLTGLPPAYVSTMEFDPLRDEGIEYALRLLQAGVPVELHQFPGTFHGSSMFPTAEISRRSSEEMMDALRRGLRAKR